MRRKAVWVLGAVAGIVLVPHVFGHDPRARTPIRIPDILEYQTLKCDFHIHTVFSDGKVWPDVRPEEAWREGLDAIAITDHIEYQPHRADLPTNHDRSYEIAAPHGETLQIIVIRGSEVTRDMPPGHLNAIFLDSVVPLDTEDWRDALRAAKDQGAFIFWNHPGWTGQQPDGVARWYPEHTELVEQGFLHGIEVVNEREYYPEAHRWCLEKGLTMLSNSDIHAPVNLDYLVRQGDHRPVTLVFARERTAEAIKEALFDRRTAVYSGGMLIGEERFLRPIFERSVSVLNPSLVLTGRSRGYIQIENRSDLDYELESTQELDDATFARSLVLQGGKTVLLDVRARAADQSGTRRLRVSYTVTNLKITPEEGLPVDFEFDVTFHPRGD